MIAGVALFVSSIVSSILTTLYVAEHRLGDGLGRTGFLPHRLRVVGARLVRGGARLLWATVLVFILGGTWLVLAVEGFTSYLGVALGPELYALHRVNLTPSYSIAVESRQGGLLGTAGRDRQRREPLAQVPEVFADLVIALEDVRFRNHDGVDRIRLMGAFVRSAQGEVEGGSTITMQLAKMVKSDSARTVRRKLDDMALALAIEQRHSKDEILRLYADHAFFGHNVYGLSNACHYYFARYACTGLTLAEAAFLAGVIKAPSTYSTDLALGRARRDLVLSIALGSPLPPARAGLAQYLTWWVSGGFGEAPGQLLLDRDRLARKYGRGALLEAMRAPIAFVRGDQSTRHPFVRDIAVAELGDHVSDEVLARGVSAQLTIDERAQAIAEDALATAFVLAEPEGKRTKLDGGLVVLDAASGDVLALVGGRDYSVSQVPFALRPIQVGSAIKPFIYAEGVERGVVRPGGDVLDAPVCVGAWCPRNFGEKYAGVLSVEQALARSLNSVAVRIGAEVGVDRFVLRLRELGFTSPLQPNLTLALGASEVSLLELATAYTALLDGAVKPARLISAVSERGGLPVAMAPAAPPSAVFLPESVALVRDGMRLALEPGGTAVRLGSGLARGYRTLGTRTPPDIACKTGTTNDSVRVGMVCLISDSDLQVPLVVAVYLGHRVPTPLGEDATGGRLAGPAMLHALLALSQDRSAYRPFGPQALRGPPSRTPPPAGGARSEPAPATQVVEASGRHWLHDLYLLGLDEQRLLELAGPLALRSTRHTRFTERALPSQVAGGGPLDRAGSLLARLGHVVAVRLGGAKPPTLVAEPSGFAVIEQQSDRVVVRRLRGREDLDNVRVFGSGQEALGLDLITKAAGTESYAKIDGRWRRLRCVRVAVSHGTLAGAWRDAGLDSRLWSELLGVLGGSDVDLDRIGKGFEVTLLIAGRLELVAVRVRAPQPSGELRERRLARLPFGVFDSAGGRVGASLWPIAARKVETITTKRGRRRLTSAAIFHTEAGAVAVAPTRLRVLAVDGERHAVQLRSAAGVDFELRGVGVAVETGEVLATGELLGTVDARGLLMVRAQAGLEAIALDADPGAPLAAAALMVQQHQRQLELLVHGAQRRPVPTLHDRSTFAVREARIDR